MWQLTLAYCLLSSFWKATIIQHNIFRNRKLGDDSYASKWHWWQGAGYLAVLGMVVVLHWQILFWELPLSVLFAIVFNGLNNLYTFKQDNRPFWYVPPLRWVGGRAIYAGSAMDRWLQKRNNPVLWLKVIQLGALAISLFVFFIGWHYHLL